MYKVLSNRKNANLTRHVTYEAINNYHSFPVPTATRNDRTKNQQRSICSLSPGFDSSNKCIVFVFGL